MTALHRQDQSSGLRGSTEVKKGRDGGATGESGVSEMQSAEHLVNNERKKQMHLGKANGVGVGGLFSPAHIPNLQQGKHPLLDACHVHDGARHTLTGF